MLFIYGILALISSIVFVIFVKKKPPTPPSSKVVMEKIYMFKGFRLLFSNRNFIILIVVFSLSLGTFNMITTYVELIVIPRGYDSIFAGILGMALLSGGIIGTIIMSLLSDKLKHRKIIMMLSLMIATISLLVFSYSYNALILIISMACYGFGLMGSGPVTLEYAVDATKPVPEASSNGILMMGGAIGGIILIMGLENVKFSGDYFPALIIQTVLLAFCVVLSFFLKEFKVNNDQN